MQVPNGSPNPKETYAWDRTPAEQEQRERDQIISRTPFPTPESKTLPPAKFFHYWADLIKLPVAKYARVYVRRWFPVLLPEEIEDERSGLKRESHPSEKKYTMDDGPLDEKKLLTDIGVGDYTFRLNDSRRPWDQATIVHGEKLCTMRNWDLYPPIFDKKRLDWDDDANRVYIKWAQSRGDLRSGSEAQKGESEMAQAAVLDNVLEMGKEDRARVDALRQQQLDKAEAELRETKAKLADLEKKVNTPVEVKKEPASDLVTTVGSLVDIVKAIKPEPDNSLPAYLALQMEREKTQRAEDAAARQAASDAAKLERDRADKLQTEILNDLRNRANAPAAVVPAPAAPKTLVEQFQEMEALMGTAKRIARGVSGVEEEQPVKTGIAEKIIEAIPAVAPIVGNLITLGFQTFQQWHHNQAAIKIAEAKGKAPDAAPTPAATPPPGAPAAVPADQPMPPTLTPEQVAQQQQFTFYMQMLSMAAPKMLAFLKKDIEDPGFQFATWVIENAPHERADYDAIRELGMEQVTGEHGHMVKQFNLARAKMNILNLVQHHPQLSAAVGPIQSRFDTFLDQFFNYDEIMAQEAESGEGVPLQ